MRIASMILKDYNLIKESGINEIHITFNEMVQIIIGTNGSGKSSILRQLSAYPPVRSLFGKRGFKSITFERDGIYYRLESEFEKPSSPHLFYEGDSEENLNVGRTTQTQQELITEHLGITQMLDDLIMNRYVFPKWGAARRKEFLMGANPDQIGFVLAHIKNISSQIKACRNNLSRLAERKILLEQQLVDEETMTSLLDEKAQIEKDLSQFQQYLMDLEIGSRSLVYGESTNINHLPQLKKTIKRARYRLSGLAHVSRDDHQRQRDRESYLSRHAVITQQLQQKEEEITHMSTQLGDMEVRYRELVVDGDLLQIDSTIERLEFERQRLEVERPAFELTPDELERRYQELDTLIDRLQIFANLTVPLLPTKRRQHRERMLQTSQYKQSSWGMRLSDYKTQHAELSQRHRTKPSDIPDSPCAKDACPLYAHFMGEYQNTEGRRLELLKRIETGERRIARLNLFVEALGNYLQQSRPYTDEIQWLISYAQSNPVLHGLLRQMDILTVLSTNPNRIGQNLRDAYARIDQWHKLKAVLADLETAHALKSRQISSESHDTIKLVSSINQTKETLQRLRSEIQTLSKQHLRYEQLLNDVATFNEVKETILKLQYEHLALMQVMANNHERDNLQFIRTGVENLRAQHFFRMSEIEKTLRAQSGLKERYEEEVISQIQLIERELTDLQQIEAALIVIPKENMVGFINNVFDQANRLIESIWTVPLKIEPLTMDNPLNYDFQVSGDNQSLRELSECSEGQTEILSLAINLALRIVLGHFDYPLCLDETGRTFDEQHRQNLVLLLKRLLDDKVISQLFYISHDAMLYDSFIVSETLVVRDENILLPETYNKHVSLM